MVVLVRVGVGFKFKIGFGNLAGTNNKNGALIPEYYSGNSGTTSGLKSVIIDQIGPKAAVGILNSGRGGFSRRGLATWGVRVLGLMGVWSCMNSKAVRLALATFAGFRHA